MPSGVSWPKYITFVVAAFLSMAVGSQIVNAIYQPLKDLPDYVEREKSRLRQLQEEASSSK